MSKPRPLGMILAIAVMCSLLQSCDRKGIQSGLPRGTVGGKVLNANNHFPVSGVTITCAGESTISDDNGVYFINNIPKGVQDLHGEKEGYAPYTIGLYVTSSTVHTIYMGQVGVFGTLTGRVLLGDSNHPVEGVLVRCGSRSGSSGRNGWYFLDSLRMGHYSLEATKNHYLAYESWVEIDGSVTHDIRLAASSVSGTVGSLVDGPLENVVVRIGDLESVSDTGGYYRIDPAPQGTHTISATHPGYNVFRAQIRIDSEERQFDVAVTRPVVDTLWVQHDATLSEANFEGCSDCPQWGSATENYGYEPVLKLEHFLQAASEADLGAFSGRSRFVIRLPELTSGVTGRELEAARLTLFPTGESANPGCVSVRRLYPSSQTWSEHSITWSTAPAARAIPLQTGDVDDGDDYQLDVLQIYADLSDPIKGLLFQKEESGISEGTEFIYYRSSEAPDPQVRPRVIITYTR